MEANKAIVSFSVLPPSLPLSLSSLKSRSLTYASSSVEGGTSAGRCFQWAKLPPARCRNFGGPPGAPRNLPCSLCPRLRPERAKLSLCGLLQNRATAARSVSASGAVPGPPSPASRNPWKLPCSGFSPRFRELHSARSCKKAAGAAAGYKKPEMPSERLSVRAADWAAAAAAAASASRGRQAARSGRPSVSSVSGGGGGGAFNVRSAPPQKGTGGGRRRSTLEKKEEREREKEFRKPSQLNLTQRRKNRSRRRRSNICDIPTEVSRRKEG